MDCVILLADDDAGDRELTRYALSEGTVAVDLRCVEDGEQAIDYLAGNPPFDQRSAHPLPDFMLLDLKMPKRSGFEVLEWVRSRAELRSLPIAVLSSSSERRDVERAYEAGASSYLVKSADLDAFAAALRSAAEFAALMARKRAP